MISSIDPVTLEVIRNALIAGAEEMSATIWRTARSTVVRETLDFSTALFDGEVRGLKEGELGELERDGMATTTVVPGTGLLSAMTAAGLAPSNAAARRLVAGGGVYVNGQPVADPTLRLDAAGALYGRYHVVRRGRKNWHLVVLEG